MKVEESEFAAAFEVLARKMRKSPAKTLIAIAYGIRVILSHGRIKRSQFISLKADACDKSHPESLKVGRPRVHSSKNQRD